MTLEQIREYASLYNLPQPLSYKELPRATSGNTSYIIDTPDKQYVIRTLIRQSIDSANDEHTIQVLLENAGITTPLYIKSVNGNMAETINDTSIVVSELVPGSRQQHDTIELAKDMGATLAKIHDTLLTTHISFNGQQWFNPRNTELQLEKYVGPDKHFISEMTAKYSKILDENLPLAVTHGDFHTNNIFSANDKVTAVFDFESAEYTVRILDIARLYLTYIKVTDLEPEEVIQAIIAGYNSAAEFGLTELEESKLEDAFIYVALVSSVSIYNHGNLISSSKYLNIAKDYILSQENK